MGTNHLSNGNGVSSELDTVIWMVVQTCEWEMVARRLRVCQAQTLSCRSSAVTKHFKVYAANFFSVWLKHAPFKNWNCVALEACKTECKLASAEGDSPKAMGVCATDSMLTHSTLITVAVRSFLCLPHLFFSRYLYLPPHSIFLCSSLACLQTHIHNQTNPV